MEHFTKEVLITPTQCTDTLSDGHQRNRLVDECCLKIESTLGKRINFDVDYLLSVVVSTGFTSSASMADCFWQFVAGVVSVTKVHPKVGD